MLARWLLLVTVVVGIAVGTLAQLSAPDTTVAPTPTPTPTAALATSHPPTPSVTITATPGAPSPIPEGFRVRVQRLPTLTDRRQRRVHQ